MISNHPNEYVYFNELAGGINGAYGNYETDYYSNSCRKAAEWIAKQVPLGQKVTVAINNEPLTASYYAQRINPNIEFMWVRDYEEQKPRWDYLILTSRTFSKNELLNGSFPPKGTVFEVKADQVPLAVVVKRENYFMPDGYTYYDNKNADSAIFFFDKAVQYNPKDEEAYRMLGCSYLNKNSLDTAELYINKSIEIYPENYSAYSNKGTIYLNRNQYDKALEYYNKATYLKRNLTEAHYYASVCEMQKNNYQGAIKHLESALKHNGQIYEVYYNLGVAYLNVGNYNKAEENFGNALTLNPNSAQGYLALGEVYKKMGRQQEYEACMQRYQQLAGR
jgi:tetratricopeptide (TPR) repeat protein